MRNLLNVAIMFALGTAPALSQSVLPSDFSFSLFGDFQNPVPVSGASQWVIANDLDRGFNPDFDLTGVPPGLTPSGPLGFFALPLGSGSFQWGVGDAGAPYTPPSALWFEPPSLIDVVVSQPFTVGFLHFRNGSDPLETGVSNVDLVFSSPESPGTLLPVSISIFNTASSIDTFLDADFLQLVDLFTPIPFTDDSGNPYTFEVSLVQDLDFGDGSYVSGNEFRVAEGTVGRAELVGRFYTTPIPEPSSLLLAAIGGLVIFQRFRFRLRHRNA